MRAARLGAIALAAAAALAGLAGQDKPSAPPAAEVRPKSFVRMDLLNRPARELMPPKRSIFSPSAEDDVPPEAVGNPGAPPPPFPPPGGIEGRRPFPPGRTPAAESTTALPFPSLRYIGFIKSPRSIVGLVLVQGQAMAVATGDMVADMYKIGTITPKEIEIAGPDGSKMMYPLEGEEE